MMEKSVCEVIDINKIELGDLHERSYNFYFR